MYIHVCTKIYPFPPPSLFLSLSCSPKRSPREILLDQDATNNIFKQKYPKAKEEMEEKLQVNLQLRIIVLFHLIFLSHTNSLCLLTHIYIPAYPPFLPLRNFSLPSSPRLPLPPALPPALCPLQEFLTKYSESNLQFSDSNINFGRHQILECARDTLDRSRDNALSKDQVIAMCNNLEGTLVEVNGICIHVYMYTCFVISCHGALS